MSPPITPIGQNTSVLSNPLPFRFQELIRLRWVAVFGQWITILVTRLILQVEIPLLPLFLLVGLTAVSNAIFAAWAAGRSDAEISAQENEGSLIPAMVLGLDLVMLTAMLYFSGGVSNPFFLFYLVNLGLSAFVVRRFWAWGLYGVAVLGFTSLLISSVEIEALRIPDRGRDILAVGHPTLLHWGFLVSFATCGFVIVLFSCRLHQELRSREQESRNASERQAHHEKLEALATLAAGAAHELATPLSTIAIVATELEKALASNEEHSSVRDDAKLIRREVDRCRRILDRMASDAGEPSGEPLRVHTVKELIAATLQELDEAAVHVECEAAVESVRLRIPLQGLAQALRGLVRNALDASPEGVSVVLVAFRSDDSVVMHIRDRGAGMDPITLQRVAEPFFTTKPPGRGMGLGVFLARTLVERLHGTVTYDSTRGQGTTVIVRLPLLQAEDPL